MCYLTFIDLFYCYLETKELENPTGENNWDQEYNCQMNLKKNEWENLQTLKGKQ